MEYPDLSPYEYYEFPLPMRNVGWLGPSFIPRPPAPDVDPRPLRAASRARSNVMLGWHDCPWCPGTTAPHDGNGEYHYYAHDGEVYAAPVMLLHYVEVHGYRPPEQFLQALRVPGELPWDDRAERLATLLFDPSEDVPLRAAGIVDLASWKHPRTIDVLLRAAHDPQLVDAGVDIGRALALLPYDVPADDLPELVRWGFDLQRTNDGANP
ncbi:hypothetical protein GCM10009827_030870 [Dactylosporangium maewongense]|uniref:DUF7919 domain-containing protein n=1 Tax=Dactylosporangium maewongense TaxID=634393 RepID=A0ABN2A962_9ACTN